MQKLNLHPKQRHLKSSISTNLKSFSDKTSTCFYDDFNLHNQKCASKKAIRKKGNPTSITKSTNSHQFPRILTFDEILKVLLNMIKKEVETVWGPQSIRWKIKKKSWMKNTFFVSFLLFYVFLFSLLFISLSFSVYIRKKKYLYIQEKKYSSKKYFKYTMDEKEST